MTLIPIVLLLFNSFFIIKKKSIFWQNEYGTIIQLTISEIMVFYTSGLLLVISLNQNKTVTPEERMTVYQYYTIVSFTPLLMCDQ